MTEKTVSLSLPKGEALEPIAEYLENIKFPISGYNSKNRTYRPEIKGLPVRAKIMAEKDIACQVAVENYDIGICGLDWIREHAIKYKGTKLHIFMPLKEDNKKTYPNKIFVCSATNSGIDTLDDLKKRSGYITIVSEYVNIAKNFAIENKLRKFKVFSAWGSVEAYPPDHADIVILAAKDEKKLQGLGLCMLKCELESDIYIILNQKKSLTRENISAVLRFFSNTDLNK